MKRVRLSDDVIERYIQYALVCKYLRCLPYVETGTDHFIEVPDELYDKVLELIAQKPKVVVAVRFLAKPLTYDVFRDVLGVEPLHIFYSPEGIFTIVFDKDVDMGKLRSLISDIFRTVVEVR